MRAKNCETCSCPRPAAYRGAVYKTRDQVERMRLKAVQFLEDVAKDPARADEFEAMSTEDYADHKGIRIINPGGKRMAKTKADLERELRELREENEVLQEQISAVTEIVAPQGSDDEDEEEEDEDGWFGEDDEEDDEGEDGWFGDDDEEDEEDDD